MSLDLQDALERLYGLERRNQAHDLGGTRALLAALGDPQRRFRSVLVAGTNGKGSTCAMIERVLRESGHRTGLFTSPHLVDFRERIRVDGRWADGDRLVERLAHAQALPAGQGRTFFEVCTALAFDDFAFRGVEWAVVEVGLGGRLDCTNTLEPDLCVITSIGLDHVEILGNTIESIAAEKAGIVRPGVPLVLPGTLDARARAVIEGVARERGAPILRAARPNRPSAPRPEVEWETRCNRWPDLKLGGGELRAAFQLDNLGTALAALEGLERGGLAISRDALERGVRATRWPGRFESAPGVPRLWWDGAHNADGMAALECAWQRRSLAAPVAVVLAVSHDKDLAGMLGSLRRFAGDAVLFAARTRNPRALDPVTLAARAREFGFRARIEPDVTAGCRAALALPGEAPVLLCGSLFAIGEAMESFGGAPGEWL